MIDCSFLPVFYEKHTAQKQGRPVPAVENFHATESVWLDFYGVGRFEAYQFVYSECKSIAHLQEWLVATRGAEQVQAAATAFREWTQQRGTTVRSTGVERRILSDEQMQSWQEQGYIKVSGLIDKEACDAVTDFICSYLGLDLHDPSTWYLERTDWHGLMVQQYQHASMQAIRSHPDVKQLFAELYNTDNIILQTDKVSFNPPETNEWKFVHHQLHWDMDYQKPNPTYIQGLIYLNDVPRDRGPLKVVPGFHRQFDEWKEKYPDEAISYEEMRKLEPEYISGKKGDIVLWLQTLPHAASPNHSDLPRFVQYLSFNRL